MADAPQRGDFIILTPAYVQANSAHLGGLDPTLYHLCRAISDADDTFVGLDHLTAEYDQAMCEALAHSAKGPHYEVWLSD